MNNRTPLADLHTWTMLHDWRFDSLMCFLFGPEWRWEMPTHEQRLHAKHFNFGAVMSIDGDDIREAILARRQG